MTSAVGAIAMNQEGTHSQQTNKRAFKSRMTVVEIKQPTSVVKGIKEEAVDGRGAELCRPPKGCVMSFKCKTFAPSNTYPRTPTFLRKSPSPTSAPPIPNPIPNLKGRSHIRCTARCCAALVKSLIVFLLAQRNNAQERVAQQHAAYV